MHKTIKVQCQKVCNCWVHDCKTISVQYHVGLQLLHFVLQNTLMVQYQLGGSCVFACVKLCIYGQWMHLEYCQSCQSRLVHQERCITKQFTVEFVTAKQARYSSQQIAIAELIIAKLPQYNTTWFTFCAFGTAKQCKTRMVAAWYITNPFAVAVCLYNCAFNLWAANALRIWSQLT